MCLSIVNNIVRLTEKVKKISNELQRYNQVSFTLLLVSAERALFCKSAFCNKVHPCR